jgi:hypothetical protein
MYIPSASHISIQCTNIYVFSNAFLDIRTYELSVKHYILWAISDNQFNFIYEIHDNLKQKLTCAKNGSLFYISRKTIFSYFK